jgi:hypothetical protein
MGLLSLLGCAWADHNMQPGPAPVVGISAGAVTNVGLVALKRPWWQRLIVVAGVDYVGRFTPLMNGRKNAEWHIEFTGGAWLGELLTWPFCKGPCR